MSYIATDKSAQDGSPALLFQFAQGTQVWHYTNAAGPIVLLGETWEPTPIKNSKFSVDGAIEKNQISLDFPRGHEFAGGFLSYAPDSITSVTIFRFHTTDADEEALLAWKGRVSSTKNKGGQITLECDPIFNSLGRYGLRAVYQRSCRHPLFSKGCGLSAAAWGEAATVTAATGDAITVPEAAAFADGYFAGGMVEDANGTFRFIYSHSGSQLTLIRPVRSFLEDLANELTPAATIYPGCNRSLSTCTDKFSNHLNFGGFRWIPEKNPMGGSSII